MATFVLVHGAWSGAHGFRHVRRALQGQGQGHDVFTPSLTGVGERRHLTSPQVGLTTHVADVVNQVLYEDLESVASLTGQEAVPMALEEPWLVPPPARAYDDPAEAAFMAARRTPMPRRCFSETVRLSTPLEDQPFERTFIWATQDRQDMPPAIEQASERARTSPRWHYREIDTGHMVASNRSAELVAMLVDMV